MLDKDIPRCARVCYETKKPLEPGNAFHSVLIRERNEIKRRDYSEPVWLEIRKKLEEDDKIEILCYWSGRVAVSNEKKIKMAPNDILLNLFDELADEPDKADIRYVLALLLIRRRIFRYEHDEMKTALEQSYPELQVYSPRRETVYSIPVMELDEQRIEEIQDYLASLLYSIN